VSRTALLDVNLLIALFESDHPHHEVAHDWFADHNASGWATCPLTQNAFVRILSNPRQGIAMHRAVDLAKHLTQFCANRHHVFWHDSVSLTDKTLFNLSVMRGSGQVADIYLLGLAKKMGGSLATFDAAIPLGSVIGAGRDTLVVLGEVSE
jgi:toxin-antitoxin system PIN domain toxin